MTRLLHDIWSCAVDYSAFGMINLLQLRGRAGSHTAEEFVAYVDRHAFDTLDTYYRFDPDRIPTLDGGGIVRYASGYPTGFGPNDTAHVEIWPGPCGLRSPAMILLHGFMSVSDVGYRIWARHLNQLGWTALLFDLPFHYRRKPPGMAGGEAALSSNLILTAETIRQGVIDLRLLCHALRRAGAEEVGCWATSYGGWLAGLLCVTEPALSTAWLTEAITDVDHAIWESPASITLRGQLRRRGITREMTARHLRLVCPGLSQPVIPPERILLLAGHFDRIAPVHSIKQLHQRWAGSHYQEIRQGHVGYQLMPASWRLARERLPELFHPEK
jgi:pimeloyl-ACP methyl ester carboxylesterase